MRTPRSGQEVSRKSAAGRGVTQALWMRQGGSLACTCCGRKHSHRSSLGSAAVCHQQRSSEPRVGQPAHSRAAGARFCCPWSSWQRTVCDLLPFAAAKALLPSDVADRFGELSTLFSVVTKRNPRAGDRFKFCLLCTRISRSVPLCLCV